MFEKIARGVRLRLLVGLASSLQYERSSHKLYSLTFSYTFYNGRFGKTKMMPRRRNVV